MAERLGRGLQNLLQQFESARYLEGSEGNFTPLPSSMKYSTIIGITAAIALIIACFMPWTFHPDLQKYFTGFYSEQNIYGKPGKLFLILSFIAIVLFLVPKVWAKRTNWLVTTITLAYAIKSYILFTSCYSGICPVKQPGIYLVMISVGIMVIAAILPDLRLKEK